MCVGVCAIIQSQLWNLPLFSSYLTKKNFSTGPPPCLVCVCMCVCVGVCGCVLFDLLQRNVYIALRKNPVTEKGLSLYSIS